MGSYCILLLLKTCKASDANDFSVCAADRSMEIYRQSQNARAEF